MKIKVDLSKITYFRDYINFYKFAKNRMKSNKDHLKFENFQAGIVIKYIKSKGISFNGKKVSDLGCDRVNIL